MKKIKNMKRILIFLVLMLIGIQAYAGPKSISYSYKIFTEAGCKVKYRAIMKDQIVFLLVEVSSDNLTMPDNPELKIRTSNDELITIEGQLATSKSNSVIVPIGGILAVPVSDIVVSALFPFSEEQIEMLSDGISKIRISLLPVNHERPFKNDKFGKQLYQLLKEASLEDDEF